MRADVKNRKRMYDDHTGESYENARYGDPYKEQYRQIRNETIAGLIRKQLGESTSTRVLEVGCGTGMTLTYLASLPDLNELYGLDFSHTMLSQAHQKRTSSGDMFQLAQGDSFRLPFPEGVFDAVYSTRFIHQFSQDDKKNIYREMLRVTKQGGVVINEFYSRHPPWTHRLRGVKKLPVLTQCPSRSEVDEIVGGHYTVNPVRVVGMSAIHRLLGGRSLRYITALAEKPWARLLLEEYLVTSKK